MKKIFLNRVIKNHLLLFLVLFIAEMIFRVVLEMPLIDWAVLRIFLGINIISMICSILFSFCGRIASNILTYIVALVGTIYTFIQASFYNYIGVFVSLGTSNQLGAVKEYIKDYMDSFKSSFYYILIPLLLITIYYLVFERKVRIIKNNESIDFSEKFNTIDLKEREIAKHKKDQRVIAKTSRINYIIITMVLCGVYFYTLEASFMTNELQLRTTKELFTYPDLPNLAVGQFGVDTFGLLDIHTTIFPQEVNQDNQMTTYVKEEQVITDNSRIIDDTAWDELQKNTTNNDYKTLNNYFSTRTITEKNDYTGLFENKNLIVIMMESTNTIALNEAYFPNISKLANEGWNFTNAFSPRNSCSTGNNEMSGMTSLYTINRSCTANIYKDNVYPEAIFNLFNNAGYSTSSYHNYTEKYYYRKTIHPNMGSNRFYGVTDLGIPYNSVYEEWPSDVSLVDNSADIFLQQDKYMAWLTTVSSHQPYTVSSEMGDMYLDLFKDTNYNTSLKRYMSKLKVLDNAIGELLTRLEKDGTLDDTVILLYADHYPYGLTNNTLNDYFDYNVNTNNEVDRTPFIIYNSQLTATEYTQYTSYMNIVPTIANLFNLDYDPRLYVGSDILSDDYENRVIFSDGSWQDDIAFYNATTGKITYYGDETYTSDYIIAVNKEISVRIKMSNTAITSNYFEYLYKGLEEYKVETPTVVPESKKEEETEEKTTE